MSKFKKGDKVRVARPPKDNEYPMWVPLMNKMLGRTTEVLEGWDGILKLDCVNIGRNFVFSEKWLEHASNDIKPGEFICIGNKVFVIEIVHNNHPSVIKEVI